MALARISPGPNVPKICQRDFSHTNMFSRAAACGIFSSSRLFSSSAVKQTKVAVLGAGGGIGQPLSLLLKNDPLVTSLNLYDIRGAPGVAADVSHIDTGSEVRPFSSSVCYFLR